MAYEKKSIQISNSFKEVFLLTKNGHLDDATKLANKLYNDALKINDIKGIVSFYKSMVTIFMIKSENHKAITYIQKLIVIYKKENKQNELGELYIKYGSILTSLKDYKNGHHFLSKSLEININEENLDFQLITFSFIALSFNSKAQQNNYNALKYINSGIKFIQNKENQTENLRSLFIFKTGILIEINEIEQAEKILKEIKRTKSRNRTEDIEINNLEVKIMFENPIGDSTVFLQKVNTCIKENIGISDTDGIVDLLQLLKKYYLNNNDISQAYKYANEIIEIETEQKNKQVSVIDLHKKPLEKRESIEEDFEIYNKSELETAANYQQNSYSNKFVSKELNIQTLYKPSKTLSGDYIGTFDIGNNKYLMVLADVVGKGITASYISFLLDGIINTVIRTTGTFLLPNNICDINAVISNSLRNKGFVSLWAGIIDTNKNELHSVNAGHLPVFLIKNNKTTELIEGSTILGMFDKLPNINTETIDFNPSDVIIAYSDGVTESVNKKGDDYENSFKLLIEKYSKTKDFNFIDQLESDLNDFQGPLKIQDDTSCLFIEYKKA